MVEKEERMYIQSNDRVKLTAKRQLGQGDNGDISMNALYSINCALDPEVSKFYNSCNSSTFSNFKTPSKILYTEDRKLNFQQVNSAKIYTQAQHSILIIMYLAIL